MFKIKRHSKERGFVRSFLPCLAFSVLIILVCSLIMAIIANASPDSSGKIGIYSLVALVVSAAASGVFTARFKNEDSIKYEALIALLVVMAMLLLNIIVNYGKIPASSFMNYGCYFGISVLSSYLGRKRGRHPRRHT